MGRELKRWILTWLMGSLLLGAGFAGISVAATGTQSNTPVQVVTHTLVLPLEARLPVVVET